MHPLAAHGPSDYEELVPQISKRCFPLFSIGLIENFKSTHKKTCGKEPEDYSFTADAQVDTSILKTSSQGKMLSTSLKVCG
jgi:hypothetical protein